MPIRRRLVDHNPSVISFREGLALCHFELGYMLSLGGMQSEAVPHYRLALAIRQRLADENPNVPRFRQNVAQNHTHLGNALSLLGKLAEAESELHLAFAILQKQAEGTLAATEVQREMASCLSRLGKIQQRGGRASEAAASFRSAVAIMERLPTPSVGQIYDLACYQSLCAGAAEKRGSSALSADRLNMGDQAMDALRRAVALGFVNPAHIRLDSDLDPLRDREDFKLLMLDLAMPANPIAPNR